MPKIDGLKALEFIKETYPHIKVIILSMHDSPKIILKMIKAGANSYLLKSTSSKELIDVIRKVMEKNLFFNEVVSLAMQQEILQEKNICRKYGKLK